MAKTILIVEDEKELIELIKFRLEANGFKVEMALDGLEGLDKIRQLKPDLVILDVMMPKMSGYDVCRLSKDDSNTKSIPIIILTARAQAKDMNEAMRAGADDCMTKPFEPADLIARIRKFLG